MSLKTEEEDHTSNLVYEATIKLEKTKLPSVNNTYKPGIRQGKYPYLYKHPSVAKYQKEFIELAEKTDLIKIRPLHVHALEVIFKFYFRTRFWNRDLTNLVKATEDALKEVVEVDDSRTIHTEQTKVHWNEPYEAIELKVIVHERDNI
jgi:Holliday junction resolvase RusA-like endonuclease